jgi:hypothetical protein
LGSAVDAPYSMESAFPASEHLASLPC